jgi:glucosamine--fructose-6-phosphate aminotransferase (isomerizing)
MTSTMLAETREAPERVEAMLREDDAAYRAVAAAAQARPPVFAATVARGSSDHAATYLASLLGITQGLVTASLPPSLVTRYRVRPRLDQALVVGLSQSGGSPDIVAGMRAARDAGALTVAIVNVEDSPLAGTAEHVLPQRAGAERSVAATKSLICTLAAAARLVAVLTGDAALQAALGELPDRLRQALRCDWSPAVERLKGASSLYVLGRGPALGIAQESALKFKEICGLHAEAFSAAEVQHGPRAVIGDRFPLLAYALDDAGGGDTAAFAYELAQIGAEVLLAGPSPGAGLHMPLPEPLHPLLDPIVAIQAFYPLAAAVATARGLDPDQPRGLRKITHTV